jgi:hypothetical protein
MRRLGPVIAVCLGITACFTPSIPIPPPSPDLMTFDVTVGSGSSISTATFSYPADSLYVGGIVFVYDQNLGDGVIEAANLDGSFAKTQPFSAALGDQVIVTVQLKDQTPSTCVILQNGHPTAGALCQ